MLKLTLIFTNRLINLGINIEITNSKEWTALDCAAANGREKVAKMLLQSGATIESTGKIKVLVTCLIFFISIFHNVMLVERWYTNKCQQPTVFFYKQ